MSDLRKLYERTANPLYVWEAMAEALSKEQVIPEWCIPYLRDTAQRLAGIRPPTSAPWETKKNTIPAQVMKALTFSKPGKRNVFDDREVERRAMAEVLNAEAQARRPWPAKRETTPPTEKEKRARKERVKRGKRLLA